MRKIIIVLLVLPVSVFAQNKGELKTKMDIFESKTGSIIKFIDKGLPQIRATLGSPLESRVRKVTTGSTVGYFYQVENKGEYGDVTASIEYSDLLEVIKALKVLIQESEKDANSIDYLENKFVTADGFQIGYYVSKGKLRWYLTLDRYSSGKTVFVSDAKQIESTLSLAKSVIDEMKR